VGDGLWGYRVGIAYLEGTSLTPPSILDEKSSPNVIVLVIFDAILCMEGGQNILAVFFVLTRWK